MIATFISAQGSPQKDSYIIGTILNAPPYSFLDENGQPAGYNVDLTRAIAGIMNLDVEIIIEPWEDLRRNLETGKIDALVGMYYSKQRDRILDFSPPYMVSHHAVFMRRGDPGIETEQDLRGKDIILLNGDIMHEYVLENGLNDNPVLVNTPEEALSLLASGKQDYAILSRLQGLFWTKELKLPDIVTTGPLLSPSQVCFALREGDIVLQQLISEGLTTLARTEEHKIIYDRWLGVLEPRGISPGTVSKYAAIAGAVILLLTILFILWSQTLRRQVALRTEALRESEEKFRSIVEASRDWIWAIDIRGIHIYCSPAVVSILGYKPEEIVGRSSLEFLHPEDTEKVIAHRDEWKKERIGWQELVLRWRHKDGTYRYLESNAVAILDSGGNLTGFRGVDRDITSRQVAEQALHESEERFRELAEMLPEGVFETDCDLNLTYANRNALKLFGYSESDLKNGLNGLDVISPEGRNLAKSDFAMKQEGEKLKKTEYLAQRKDGSTFPALFNASSIMKDGHLVGLRGIIIDLTGIKQAEEIVKREKEKAELYLNKAGVMILALNTLGNVTMINRKGCEILGYSEADILGKNWFDNFIPGRSAVEVKAIFGQLIRDEIGNFESVENLVLAKNGEEKQVVWHNTVLKNDEGQVVSVLSSGEDITEIRRAELEKSRLEERYQQSQKVESLGRLAGGVAHDLNNLLTPILGYGEILLNDLDSGDPLRKSMDQIMRAGFRARDLVSQLLAFGRKQTLEYRPVDLDKVLKGFEALLRRTIREDIEIKIISSHENCIILADVGQIEQVLMNMAVNAQDAMSGGGLLTFETSVVELDEEFAEDPQDVDTGTYVKLSVKDTGSGMDKETLVHVFEPFYSTKGQQGTGLGLATVFGIIKQHKGHILAFSETGKGTTFEIYLPVSGDMPPGKKHIEKVTGDLSGSETILLVEDNESVRNLTSTILQRRGYTILSAEDGPNALKLLEPGKLTIHLLLTDVILPDMNGRDLYTEVVKQYPDIKVLYMSGYADDVIARHGILEEGINFIQKPFAGQALSLKVREILDSENVG